MTDQEGDAIAPEGYVLFSDAPLTWEHLQEPRLVIDSAYDSWAVVNDCGAYIELAYRGRVFIVQKGYLVERSSTAGGGLAFLPPQVVGLKAVEK